MIWQGIIFKWYYSSLILIYIPSIVILSGIQKTFRQALNDKIGYKIGEIINISLIILFNTLYITSILEGLDNSDVPKDPKILISYLATPFLAILIVIWISIHLLVFTKQPNEIYILRAEIKAMENPSMGIQTILNRYPNLLDNNSSGFFQNYGHLLASLSIIIALISVEIGLINIVLDNNPIEYPNPAKYVAGMYIIALPCFIFLGTICSASILKKDDKYCIGIILFGILPTIGVEAGSYYLYQNPDTYYIGILLGVGLPGTIVYWLSMSTIYNYNKRSYQYFTSICFLILFIPLGLMWPLYSAGGMNQDTFWVVIGVLFFGGLIVLSLWLMQLLLKITKDLWILIKEVKKFNGHDLSQYIYTVGFLISFALLAWILFKRQSMNNDWIGGLIPGCFGILGFMILGTLLVHRLRLYTAEIGVGQAAMRDIIKNTLPEPTPLQLKYQSKKKKYQTFFATIGIILAFAISIPILVLSSNESLTITGITIIIGLLSCTLIILLLIELKSVLQHFGETVISYGLGCCWLFFLVPIICLIPVSLASAENASEVRSITSWSIGSILLLFMIGVSVGSITLNLVFKRLEYEKIAKFCCKEVRKVLLENGVKANLITLRSVYDNFKISGGNAVEKVLENATVFYYHDIEPSDPDLRFSKEILTIKEISKLKANSNIAIIEEEEIDDGKGLSLRNMIRKWCTNKYEDEKITVKEQLNPEELVGIEIQDSSLPDNQDKDIIVEADGNDWDNQFKETVNRVANRESSLIHTINYKMNLDIMIEPEIKNENISVVKLKPKTKQELINSKHLNALLSSSDLKHKWLRAVFHRFSSGMIDETKEPWMNLSDLRQFMRISGLKPYISYAACDILYVRLTRIYNPDTYTKKFVKLDFKQFSTNLFQQIGKLRFPDNTYQEAAEKIFKEEVYPNLVTNLTYLYQYYPEISDDNLEVNPDIEKNINLNDNHRISQSNQNFTEIIDNPPVSPKENSINADNYLPMYIKGNEAFVIETENKICLSRCFDQFSVIAGKLFKAILTCLGKCFGLCLYCLMPTSSEKNKIADKKPKDEIELLERRLSPPWEVICHLIITTFTLADKEASKNHRETHPEMQLNLSNLIAVFSCVSEIYSFAAVGFSSQVGWVYGKSFTDASTVMLADNKYWVETFWICIGASFIFLLLVIPAFRYIKKGRLGLNEDLTEAPVLSFQFFLTKLISLFGSTFYLTVIASMLSAFSCTYSNNEWHLLRDSSVVCFSNEHVVYFILAIACLVFYYPLATLLYPNIAYQDKALDLKFDTTFLVIESQGKVLIAGFYAFFAKEIYIWLQLIVSILVSSLLFILCLKTKPCLVISFNLWKTGGFLIPIWICSCALLNYYSGETILALILLVVGLGIIVGIIITLHILFYVCSLSKKDRKVNPIRPEIDMAEEKVSPMALGNDMTYEKPSEINEISNIPNHVSDVKN